MHFRESFFGTNKKERLDMIYRSMGRAHDWELERFRVLLFDLGW